MIDQLFPNGFILNPGPYAIWIIPITLLSIYYSIDGLINKTYANVFYLLFYIATIIFGIFIICTQLFLTVLPFSYETIIYAILIQWIIGITEGVFKWKGKLKKPSRKSRK